MRAFFTRGAALRVYWLIFYYFSKFFVSVKGSPAICAIFDDWRWRI